MPRKHRTKSPADVLGDLYRSNFANISNLQGYVTQIGAREEAFVAAILADETITKEVLVRYIADNAFRWDQNKRSAMNTWARNAD